MGMDIHLIANEEKQDRDEGGKNEARDDDVRFSGATTCG